MSTESMNFSPTSAKTPLEGKDILDVASEIKEEKMLVETVLNGDNNGETKQGNALSFTAHT